ncbi:ABC-three component system middle component 1 [Aeromonas tecta]|uniref:ABC-three component system middle component 1 n=1 Tax=Aeromonas tecta TaxID=324617 RepID=UPI0012F9792C|nr:ABC-three component system middle component 1 [Aeromonas tecta]
MKVELFSAKELSFINCIVCWFDSSLELVEKWKAIQSIISVRFKPEARFSKWNIYLVMLCPDSIEIQDKYVIENDRYAARKIVLDRLGKTLTTKEVETKINAELLGADLELQQTTPSLVSNIKLAIAPLIKNTPTDLTSKSKDKRGEIVNKLIEYYRQNENKKS